MEMKSGGPQRKKWDLTAASLRGLLEFLDPDSGQAPQQYEKIREKLTRFFEWKGCVPGDEYADETLDRVARKLEEGLEKRPQNPYLYIHGVAVNVIRERWRKAAREPQVVAGGSAFADPQADDRALAAAEVHARRLDCLEDCLNSLGTSSRRLLTSYHLDGGRKGLAASIDLPAAALRLRVFRIRRRLERCISQCMNRDDAGNVPGPGTLAG
jgi:DNA-directed RNA polymerase specialized sigma24 family protein